LLFKIYYDELVCYSDFLRCVSLIKVLQIRYHIHAVLIQDKNELFSHTTLREYLEKWINVPTFSLNLELLQMPTSWLTFLLHKAFVIFLRTTQWNFSVNSFFCLAFSFFSFLIKKYIFKWRSFFNFKAQLNFNIHFLYLLQKSKTRCLSSKCRRF
jgi:hypothetical protein